MEKISCCFLFMLAFLVGCQDQPQPEQKTDPLEDENLPVISSAEELKTIKGKKIIWKQDKSKMVLIPAKFEVIPEVKKVIPTVYSEVGDVITPQREVVIPEKKVQIFNSFFMDAHEVTVGQFKIFLKSSVYKPDPDIDWNLVYKYSPNDSYPMIYANWNGATAYAKWVGKRLPTEKEWEFAARGGLINKEYPWGDDESLARDYATYGEYNGTSPVGSFKPNGYGLHDMAGNVWEWCQDWYDSNQGYKVLRGGSWLNKIFPLRVAARAYTSPADRDNDYGFRCVGDTQ